MLKNEIELIGIFILKGFLLFLSTTINTFITKLETIVSRIEKVLIIYKIIKLNEFSNVEWKMRMFMTDELFEFKFL